MLPEMTLAWRPSLALTARQPQYAIGAVAAARRRRTVSVVVTATEDEPTSAAVQTT